MIWGFVGGVVVTLWGELKLKNLAVPTVSRFCGGVGHFSKGTCLYIKKHFISPLQKKKILARREKGGIYPHSPTHGKKPSSTNGFKRGGVSPHTTTVPTIKKGD